jgi:SM-20-related protein
MNSPARVRVRLLLAGGHVREWTCDADDPVVSGALSAIPGSNLDQSLPAEGIIQVNASPGRRLFLSRQSLVAVEVDDVVDAPAVAVLPPSQSTPLVVIRHFLDPERAAALLVDALARERDFTTAPLASGAPEHRSARVIFDFSMKAEIESAIRARLARSTLELGLPPDTSGAMETQLTVSGDGDYYRAHVDDGAEVVRTRTATYVYYFNREPKAFTGGELRLFDRRWNGGRWEAAEAFQDLVPEHNMLILFPSSALHEIRPVCCPGGGFADSRFTVNGWLHSAAAPS